MSPSITRLVLALSVGLSMMGCAVARQPVSSLCDSGLQLSIQSEKEFGVAGEILEVTFVLLNTSTKILEGCFGSAFDVTFTNDRESEGWSEPPSHKGCIERFTLQPGERASRVYDAPVPSRFDGPVKLFGGLQVVEPSNCDEYECGGVWLRSTTHPEFVIRRANK